jgi:phosphatidylglycerophosphatase C
VQKNIAFFDFDGTITRTDSMLELAKFSSGAASYWLGLALISPWLVAMKVGLITNAKAKEILLTHFFGGTQVEVFVAKCHLFTEKIIPQLIKEDAMAAILVHLQQNTTVVIVSASAENWIAPWCRKHNIQFICSQLMVDKNQITGKLKGNNCSGKEKVSRIKALFNLADYTSIYCYGDTREDMFMLGLATNRYYRFFKK